MFPGPGRWRASSAGNRPDYDREQEYGILLPLVLVLTLVLVFLLVLGTPLVLLLFLDILKIPGYPSPLSYNV